MSRIFPVLLLACVTMLASPVWANAEDSPSAKKNQRRDQPENPKDTLTWSVNYLNRIMYSGGEWYLTDRTYQKAIKGVLNYAENQPIDTSVVEMQKLLSDYGVVYIYDRRPQDIRHPENVPGYVTSNQVDDRVKSLKKQWADSLEKSMIEVPESLLENIEKEVRLIPAMDPQRLLSDSLKQMPAPFGVVSHDILPVLELLIQFHQQLLILSVLAWLNPAGCGITIRFLPATAIRLSHSTVQNIFSSLLILQLRPTGKKWSKVITTSSHITTMEP
ncbi:hypothetical protein [Prolixibacter bellariivorans]|uniref:hypothetical protein n=1 Tax=Prolixibacter bellariivorans TaxID=314319 RepID=UPI001F343405|nr:hypothetical protein [Prolixibacter bellariivorans]